MSNYFIILASGQSKRFNSIKPKQYSIYEGKPLYKHSLDKALKSKLFKKIIIVVNNKNQIKEKFSKNVLIIKGGKERSDSSLIAFLISKKMNIKRVTKRIIFNTKRYCKFLSVSSTKPLSIKVKKVKKPIDNVIINNIIR